MSFKLLIREFCQNKMCQAVQILSKIGHLDVLKNQWSLKFFSFFKIFSFKFLWVWTSKIRKIGLFVLSSTSMPIFISFEPRLLSQLSEKREKGEKTMKKECKTTCKTVEGCKTNGIDSWEDTCKTVEGDITNGFDSLGRLDTRLLLREEN